MPPPSNTSPVFKKSLPLKIVYEYFNAFFLSIQPPNAEVQIVLTYNAQKLVIDGKEQPRKVTNVIYQLSDTKTYQPATIYFQQEDGTAYYEYKTFAMQSNLYDYVMSLQIA